MSPLRPSTKTPRHTPAAGLALAAGLCFGLWSMGAHAQAPAAPLPASEARTDLDAFLGRPIATVRFEVAEGGLALSSSSENLARNQLRLTAGQAFDTVGVQDDLSRLARLGRFETLVARVELRADGRVELVYSVRPRAIVSSVQVSGNREFDDQQLLPILNTLEGTPVDSNTLERSARSIEAYYEDKGFVGTRVVADTSELGEGGTVVFRIREGSPVRVMDIRFVGNQAIGNDELFRAIETERAGLLLRGRLNLQRVRDDADAIARMYRDRGYLDARVVEVVSPSPDGREAIVEFLIEEGEQATLRRVKVSYAPGDRGVFSPEQLIGVMELNPGDLYGEVKIRRALEAVRAAYGKLGYADVVVTRRDMRSQVDDGFERLPGTSGEVDLLLVIEEGQRYRTGLIEITGNSITRDDVIRRQLDLAPERPLDATAAKESEKRLNNARLFAGPPTEARVDLQPASLDTPGYRDVIVEVTETNTGAFNFGASLGSDSGLVGQVSLQQRNFDITDTPDTAGELLSGQAFRGGGQTFTITVAPGERVRNFSIGLSEPALFGTDTTGSGTVYFRQRIFGAYDEQRYGARFSLGRRFGSLWQIAAPFTLENVELSNIDSDAPVDYFAVEDGRLLASAGVTLTRSSVDSVAFPTTGQKLSVGFQQFGLIGDETFSVLSAEAGKYFKLDQDVLERSTTLFLSARATYIPGDEDVAPFYDRLYLGGENFRGFAFRGAAPRGIRNDTGTLGDDPIGGNWLFFAGAQVTKPIFEDTVAAVAFVDTGTVEKTVGFDDYRVSVGFGLRLYVAQLSPVPLAFDFGFPIVKEDTDRERFFTFSIDLPFN